MARPAARAPKPSASLERAVRSETVKHYAETIFYIRQEEGRVRPGRLAEWLGVSAPTVTVTLQRLARDGFVEIGTDRSVTLTPRGEDLAAKIVRVHRLLERWLTDVLGLDWAAADEEAQRLAAGVSVGQDAGAPVTDEYTPPFPFTGTLRRVVYDVSGEHVIDHEAEIRIALARQ